MKFLRNLQRMRCFFIGHDYTCAKEKGINPTKEQLAKGVEGFFDYAKLLCKNCDYESKHPSER